MRNRTQTQIVAGGFACLALVAIWWFNGERGPRVDSKLHAAIGKALARQALDLSGGSGQITVITRDTEAFKQPAIDILLESFNREIRRGNGAVAATHLIQVDPLRPIQVPPGDFFEWIRRAPAGSVIVSLLGPPLLPEEQVNQLGAIKPRIVAFCPGNLVDYVDFRMLFERQLLHAAVISRPNVPSSQLNAVGRPQSFDQLYARVTANNLSALPVISSASR